jgi:hypothetical protein
MQYFRFRVPLKNWNFEYYCVWFSTCQQLKLSSACGCFMRSPLCHNYHQFLLHLWCWIQRSYILYDFIPGWYIFLIYMIGLLPWGIWICQPWFPQEKCIVYKVYRQIEKSFIKKRFLGTNRMNKIVCINIIVWVISQK